MAHIWLTCDCQRVLCACGHRTNTLRQVAAQETRRCDVISRSTPYLTSTVVAEDANLRMVYTVHQCY